MVDFNTMLWICTYCENQIILTIIWETILSAAHKYIYCIFLLCADEHFMSTFCDIPYIICEIYFKFNFNLLFMLIKFDNRYN